MSKITNLGLPVALTDSDIPSTIARDSEVTAAIIAHVTAADPHTQYLLQSEGDSRYRQSSQALTDSDIPAVIARDSEVTAAITAHVNATDPHTQYLKKEEPSDYGSIVIAESKNGYAGIKFSTAFGAPVFMFNAASYVSAIWGNGISNSIYGWQWIYDEGNFSVGNSRASTEGNFIGLYKGLGSLPGFPDNRYPTVRTDYSTLFFSAGGQYSAYMTGSGVFTTVSDKNRKENSAEVDYKSILKSLIEKVPIYRYTFKGESDKIFRCGPYAQDFYNTFKLGGDILSIPDDSPLRPDLMLAPSDAIGILMASVKALAMEIADIKAQIATIPRK